MTKSKTIFNVKNMYNPIVDIKSEDEARFKFKSEIEEFNFLSISNLFIDLDEIEYSNIGDNQAFEDCVIVIITKDNLERIKITLSQFVNIPIKVVLLDDSTTNVTQKFFKSKFSNTNIKYHGYKNQIKILKSIKSMGVEQFISKMGVPGWTVGYCRNYALLLAKLYGYKKILMVDDDIQLNDLNTIKNTFTLLSKFDIVGAKTEGMPDDSIVGHIFREIGIEQYDFISGQYFGVNIDSISYFFPNIYNEDWIFSLLSSESLLARSSIVKQLMCDPFHNLNSKCIFQEYGEIICEGLIEARIAGNHNLLTNQEFWSKILRRRQKVLIKLELIVSCHSKDKSFNIAFDELRLYHSSVNPIIFESFFIEYFNNLNKWNKILSSIKLIRWQE